MELQNKLNHNLMQASQYGSLNTVSDCIRDGADVNVSASLSGKSPLHLAAWHSHFGITIALIKNGANVNAVDRLGRTPLHYAASINNLGIVNLLLEAGASLDIKDENGRKPIDLAANEIIGILTKAETGSLFFFIDHNGKIFSTDNYPHADKCVVENGYVIALGPYDSVDGREILGEYTAYDTREELEAVISAPIAAR